MSSKGNKHSARSLTAKSSASNKKTKTQSSLTQSFGNNAFLFSSLRKTHNGKHILLRAKAIYNGTVPDGEEAHLFPYSVQNVSYDCKTATIDFDEECINENGDFFQNYPNLADDNTTIEDYKIEMLNADHELFNVHLGQVNKSMMKVRSTNDVQDLDNKFHVQRIDGYRLLVGEFDAQGDLTEHLIQTGQHAGKKNTKQDWSKFILLCMPSEE
jgi:hypothetical protein